MDTGVFVLGVGEGVGETSAIAASRLLPSQGVAFLGGLMLVSLIPPRRPRSLLPKLSALPVPRRGSWRP